MTTLDFVMPSLGADMDSGTITSWMIKPGDEVARGDVVAVVETDKADIDIEIWNDGVVVDIVVPVGETVSVGTTLANIEVDAEPSATTPQPAATEPPPEPQPAGSTPQPPPPEPPTTRSESPASPPEPKTGWTAGSTAGADDRVAASPLARRLADERGVDLAAVAGTGPGGARLARDLPPAGRSEPGGTGTVDRPEQRAENGPGQRADDGAARMRKAIGELMARSKQEVPHYYLETTVDLEVALEWLQGYNATRPVDQRVLPAALILKATALALADHPEFNGHWIDGGFRPAPTVNLGVAISLRGGGVVAPAVHRAEELTVDELMAGLKDLVARTRSGRLRASEMTDSTVTVTSLGDRGVDVVHGVIYPPQVALLGIGRTAQRPAVVDGAVAVRRQVVITLAADHRASDGQRGARLLNTMSQLLQKPEEL